MGLKPLNSARKISKIDEITGPRSLKSHPKLPRQQAGLVYTRTHRHGQESIGIQKRFTIGAGILRSARRPLTMIATHPDRACVLVGFALRRLVWIRNMTDENIKLMAHLMRRAGFGASRDELERRVKVGYEATVEELLNPDAQEPVDYYEFLRYGSVRTQRRGRIASFLIC